MFNVKITVSNVDLPFPKRGDKWLMAEFIRAGYSGNELLRLNRVRLHMQVNFLSEVICAKGKAIDPRYLHKQKENEEWSTLLFPTG